MEKGKKKKKKKKKLTSDHWKFFYKLKNNFQGLKAHFQLGE